MKNDDATVIILLAPTTIVLPELMVWSDNGSNDADYDGAAHSEMRFLPPLRGASLAPPMTLETSIKRTTDTCTDRSLTMDFKVFVCVLFHLCLCELTQAFGRSVCLSVRLVDEARAGRLNYGIIGRRRALERPWEL